jgi:hypothetical protein
VDAAERTRAAGIGTSFPAPPDSPQRMLPEDFFPCGLSSRNRAVLERLVELAVRDGLVRGEPPAIDELFHADTLPD